MKLYYSPSACSLAPHIALCEAGIPVELIKVDTHTHKLANGDDFEAISPKGFVPALVLDDGRLLTEGPAISQYIADALAPGKGLAPANGTFERAKMQEWLNFISSEVHKGYWPLFFPDSSPKAKQAAADKLHKWFAYVDRELAGKEYLVGEFSLADCYLFTVARWTKFVQLSLDDYTNLLAFMARMNERPGVIAAIEAEKQA